MRELVYRYRQVIKFGLVGVANTLISLALLFFLEEVVKMDIRIANPLAYLLGTVNSFYLNKKWTFKSEGKVHKEGPLFFAVIGVAWLIQYVIAVYWMVGILHWDKFVAQVIGMVLFTGLNFVGQKFITFKS